MWGLQALVTKQGVTLFSDASMLCFTLLLLYDSLQHNKDSSKATA